MRNYATVRDMGLRREQRRLPAWARCGYLLAFANLLAAPQLALGEARIEWMIPGPDGTIELQLTTADEARFHADGLPVAADQSNQRRWRLAAIPTTSRVLVVQPTTGDPIAVALGPDDGPGGRYNDWNIYHVMLSFFANGSRDNDKYGMRKWIHRNYAGGDLQGVLARADYLDGLGVNAVWLSPVFATETSHGYDVTNYFEIGQSFAVPRDPDASRELFDQLVTELQRRGIRVILDLPLDYGSGAYDRRAGDPQRRRPKSTGPRQEAEKMWESWGTDFKYWNFDDRETREFLKDVARYWVTDGLVDGFRLDYVRGVPHDFWAELYADLKSVKPSVYLFGEAWQDASSVTANALDIASYYAPVSGAGPQFDGLLEYPLQMVMTEVFATGGDARQLEHWLQRTAALYDPSGRPVHFLDNHDVSRFAAWAVDSGKDRLAAAVGFMAALSSPLVIYYGTETGLSGGSARRGFVDDGRVAMPWGALDEALTGRIAEILQLRSTVPAITHGGRWPVHVDAQTLVMRKVHPTGDVLVGVNLAAEPRTVTFPAGRDAEYSGLLGTSVPEVAGDGNTRWTLPALSTTWVRVRR